MKYNNINTYVANKRIPKYMTLKFTLIERKNRQSKSKSCKLEYLNSIVGRTREKTDNDKDNLKNNVSQVDLTEVYRTSHTTKS